MQRPGPETERPPLGDSRPGAVLGSAALAAVALALIAAFLAQHAGELRSLPADVRAIAAAARRFGIAGLRGAAESAAGAMAALLVVTAWYGLGDLVLRLLTYPPEAKAARLGPLGIAWRCAVGAGGWSLVWLALGLVGLYHPATALAAVLVGLALAALAGARMWRAGRPVADRPPRSRTGLAGVAAALTALPTALALVAALAPPTAKDALQYHLALPKAFVAAGGLVDPPGNIAAYFPLGAEMHGLWAILLGRAVSARSGEAAFGATMFAFFPLLLAAVLGWVRELGFGREWAWLAAAMVAGTPTVWEVAGSGYVDLALALYVTLAFRAASSWWRTGAGSELAQSALALGFALAVKPTAAFAALTFALIALLRSRTAPGRHALAGSLAAMAGMAALAAPWYLRNWMRTGSPIFPFFAAMWPGQAPGWDAERSVMLAGFNALYGGADKGLLDYALTPLSLSLTGQREVAALYEGVLGVSFLVGAVLIAWALARRSLGVELGIAAAVAGGFFAWWLVSAEVLRYLFPALPLLAVASSGAGAILVRDGALDRRSGWMLAASVAAGEIVLLAWFAADDPLLATTGAEPRAAYLARRLDYYPYYQLANDTLPGEVRIWLVDMRRDTYHLDRPCVGDYLFEDYTLRKWIEASPDGAGVRRRALAAGITHVLIRHDILLDPARSPLVDDRAPDDLNRASLGRLRAFLGQGTRLLRADAKFALVELAPRS